MAWAGGLAALVLLGTTAGALAQAADGTAASPPVVDDDQGLRQKYKALYLAWLQEARASFRKDVEALRVDYQAKVGDLRVAHAEKRAGLLEACRAEPTDAAERCRLALAELNRGTNRALKDLRQDARQAYEDLVHAYQDRARDKLEDLLAELHAALLDLRLEAAAKAFDAQGQGPRPRAVPEGRPVHDVAPKVWRDRPQADVAPKEGDGGCNAEGLCRAPARCLGRLGTGDCVPPLGCKRVAEMAFQCDLKALLGNRAGGKTVEVRVEPAGAGDASSTADAAVPAGTPAGTATATDGAAAGSSAAPADGAAGNAVVAGSEATAAS